MQGFKMIATYTPNNGLSVLGTALGAWGDAIVAWKAAVLTGGLEILVPIGATTVEFIDVINPSTGPVIRATLVWAEGVQTPFDLLALQGLFLVNALDPIVLATLAAFDTGGVVSYQELSVEQWSGEKTI